MYYIFRSDSINGNYTLIDSTVTAYYLDSGLINLKEYCYYVKSSGNPIYVTLNNPIINLSSDDKLSISFDDLDGDGQAEGWKSSITIGQQF